MKSIKRLSSILILLFSISGFAQTFTWENLSEGNQNIQQTVDGVTATVTSGNNTQQSVEAFGFGGASGIFIVSFANNALTVSFSQVINISSINVIDVSGNNLTTYTVTPSGGSNTEVSHNYTTNGHIFNVDWINVSSFEITAASGTEDIAIDNIVFSLPDTTVPSIANITSSVTNLNQSLGQTIPIQIQFSENVTVTGTPQLVLETGATDRIIDYTSGSGTNTLTFNNTVQAGDTSTDLDYTATTALSLNGGTIQDGAGNDAILTLPEPGAAGSLSANKDIVLDTTIPTVEIQNVPANTNTAFTATFEFSEDVTGFEAGDITATNATVSDFTAVDANTYTALITPTAEGAFTLDLAADVTTDTANNGNTAAAQATGNFDSEAEVGNDISLGGDDTIDANEAADLTISGTAEVEEGQTVTLALTDGTDTVTATATVDANGNWSATGIDVSNLSDGTLTVTIETTDLAGNSATATTTVEKTTATAEPVTVSINSDVTGPVSEQDLPILITVTFASPVTGFELGDLMVENGTVVNLSGADTTYTFNLTPAKEGTVTVTLPADITQDANGNGNLATSFEIEFVTTQTEDRLEVPGGFSPNGDGINDTWTIAGGSIISTGANVDVKVYNRLGNLVFEADNYENNWDGTSQGTTIIGSSDKLPVGAYYYVVNPKQPGQTTLTGWVYINY